MAAVLLDTHTFLWWCDDSRVRMVSRDPVFEQYGIRPQALLVERFVIF
jgi:hypothetical protein